MENTHNCGDSRMQNFSISGECAKKIYAYLENAHEKIVYGECAKRMYVHLNIEYTQKESML